MGSFSWNCAICNYSIMARGCGRGYARFSEAVVQWPNGDRISGTYEDYGSIGPIENLHDQTGGWKIAHQHCAEGKPFEEWGEADHDDTQGWGYGEKGNRTKFGEPKLAGLSYVHYGCNDCRKVWTAKFAGGECPYCKTEDNCAVESMYGRGDQVVVKCLGTGTVPEWNKSGKCWYEGELRRTSKDKDPETYKCSGCQGEVEARKFDWSKSEGIESQFA